MKNPVYVVYDNNFEAACILTDEELALDAIKESSTLKSIIDFYRIEDLDLVDNDTIPPMLYTTYDIYDEIAGIFINKELALNAIKESGGSLKPRIGFYELNTNHNPNIITYYPISSNNLYI